MVSDVGKKLPKSPKICYPLEIYDLKAQTITNAPKGAFLMELFNKIVNNKIISTLIGTLIIFIAGLIYQYYSSPRIVMDYSGLYSRVSERTIGSIQITNLGRNIEEGLTVRIQAPIDKESNVVVLINGVPTEQRIVLRPDFTDIIISELYPEDDLFVSFVPSSTESTDFNAHIFGRNMRTSRYEILEWTAEWWEINETQRNALIVIILASILFGIGLGKTKLLQKRKIS